MSQATGQAARRRWPGRPVLTGLCVGLAADAKPWALIFLPLLLLAGGAGQAGWAGRRKPTGTAAPYVQGSSAAGALAGPAFAAATA